MKKKFIFVFLIVLFYIMLNFCIVNTGLTYKVEGDYYLGGMPAGFSLNTRGVEVVGICDVVSVKGIRSPAKDAGILVGDRIMSIDDFEINSAGDIENSIKSGGEKIIIINRDNQVIIENITPSKDNNGIYRIGVFVKDEINGIGTITYFTENGFASLGHPVLADSGELLKITGGQIYECTISGCIKGKRGQAGELRGAFLKAKSLGTIRKNIQQGVYGACECVNRKNLKKISIGEAKMGDAIIYSTIDGNTPKKYSISIIKVDNSLSSKNFVIKITDKNLIEKTGGIVQGMSGSPIVQNGKLVGAVTHVFINDPSRGFGISINNMINN